MATITSWTEFKADLQQLKDALSVAQQESTNIDDYMNLIAQEFAQLKSAWQSPSFATFEDTQAWFAQDAGDLRDLLEDAVRRMTTTIENYEAAELANFKNLSRSGN
ncbi:WXG100 family type VII secretion target [Streptomyces prunicolor]|uniref:WXG100 family type VII secretion target n=1 Tax=Streptomyces prunicolor TaxID=67348 RepID=UPI0033EC0951